MFRKPSLALQIVDINKTTSKISLNEELLKSVLLNNEIKGRRIIPISITGDFRTGKTFLLNFFLQYLYSEYDLRENNPNWLENITYKKEFFWKDDSSLYTTGIVMWSKVFLTTLNREKVAIILFKTQWVEDSKKVNDEYIQRLFAFSTLLSSLQIFNIKDNIQENHLRQFKLLYEYAEVMQENFKTSPFQNILFLVRDWRFPCEFPYGAKGGNDLVSKLLKVSESQENSSKKLQQNLQNLFENINGFLLPPPGEQVSFHDDFKGKFNNIEKKFKLHIKNLVSSVLSSSNLIIKKVNSSKITAENMFFLLKQYVYVLNSEKLSPMKSIFQVTLELGYDVVVKESLEIFNITIQNFEVPIDPKPKYMIEELLLRDYNAAKLKALCYFETKSNLGNNEENMSMFYKRKLKSCIEVKYALFSSEIIQNEKDKVINLISENSNFMVVGMSGTALFSVAISAPILVPITLAIAASGLGLNAIRLNNLLKTYEQ